MQTLLLPLTVLVPSQEEVYRWNLDDLARAYQLKKKIRQPGVFKREDNKFVIYDGHHRVYYQFESNKHNIKVNLIEAEVDIWRYDGPFYSRKGDDDIFPSERGGTLYAASDLEKRGIKSIEDMVVNEEE